MDNMKRRMSAKAGLPPGEGIFISDNDASPVTITCFQYDKSTCDEITVTDISNLGTYTKSDRVTWLKVNGLADTDKIAAIGNHFDMHPLLIEDILNTSMRPKIEIGEDFVFISLKRMTANQNNALLLHQVSIILKGNTVISFHEHNDGVLDSFINRIKEKKGRIRDMGSDYLAYALMDFIVDQYFGVLESFGDHLDEIQKQLAESPSPSTLHNIHAVKQVLLKYRKSVWPLRELISSISRGDSNLFTAECTPFLRDLYDHVIQIIDNVEAQRDIASGLIDLYMSSIGNRMNSVMQTLTIIATIFIPLTFVAGIYGMNFEHMPELKYRWGYPAVMGLMLAMAFGMLYYFKRKKWL